MRKNFFQSWETVVVCALICGITLSGCSPAMRKKFVREKEKTEDESFVPVLDPVDYPNTLETVKTRYEYFYALLKVWQKDALTVLEDGPSDKQMTYILMQIRLELEELQKILTGESGQKAQNGLERVDHILAYYDKPEAFRSRDIIRRDIKNLGDAVIKPLEFESVKKDLRE